MYRSFKSCIAAVVVASMSWLAASTSQAQTAYGVNDIGILFRFDLSNPSSVTSIGNVGFVPRGIDFRPSSNILYGLNVGQTTTQLFSIDTNTAIPSAIGPGFASSVVGSYDLSSPSTTLGFDFNPTTLQPDDSMRIRVVGSNGTNLRLNSSTGLVAAVDTSLAIAPAGGTSAVDGAAYINNIATAGGATQLFDMDSFTNSLYLQNPPNGGVLNSVGPFGVTINNVLPGIGFDIFTDPNSVDPGIGGDSAYAVLRRPDAPLNGVLGSYLLYDVNLATGSIANGAVVGPAASPFNFAGGFAIQPAAIPEPSSGCLVLLVGITSLLNRRRKSR